MLTEHGEEKLAEVDSPVKRNLSESLVSRQAVKQGVVESSKRARERHGGSFGLHLGKERTRWRVTVRARRRRREMGTLTGPGGGSRRTLGVNRRRRGDEMRLGFSEAFLV